MEKVSNWQFLKSEEKDIQTILFNVRQDYLINPRNQKEVKVTILYGQDAANVVPITKDGDVILIEQYRFGISKRTLEVPGGIVDPGESQEIAVKRELIEETGHQSDNWHYLGNVAANPVFQNQYIHHWLARDVELVGELELDDAEDIEVRKLPVEEVLRMFKNGDFEHPHTVTALLKTFLFLEVL